VNTSGAPGCCSAPGSEQGEAITGVSGT